MIYTSNKLDYTGRDELYPFDTIFTDHQLDARHCSRFKWCCLRHLKSRVLSGLRKWVPKMARLPESG